MPRALAGFAQVSLSTGLLGGRIKIAMPVGIAPSAQHKMAHPEAGELATALAAQTANTVYIMSMLANSSIEEVAAAAPKAVKWLQMSFLKDKQVMKRDV